MIKYTIILLINIVLLSANNHTLAKYIFNEQLDVARLSTKGNYYLITYTERNDSEEKIEKVYKDENHDKDGKILKDWIMDKRTTIETIKIEDDSGDITDCSYLFGGTDEIMVCLYLTKIDLSGFNTENVTTMSFMFYDCVRLVDLNISSLNTRKVTDMSYMFFYCSSLEYLNLTSFETNNVLNMDYMFQRCSSLQEISVSSTWTTKNATTVNMFRNCGVSNITLI